jgi:hypothetical protein
MDITRDTLPKDVKGVCPAIVDFKKTWLLNDKGFGTSVRDFKMILDDNDLKATSNHLILIR